VRRRLDFTKPVERSVIDECVEIALQAPNAGNRQVLHFVAVTSEEKRSSLADIYRRASDSYFESMRRGLEKGTGDAKRDAIMKRVFQSALYLYDHLHEVPIHVVPCISGRTDNAPVTAQAPRWGSIFPAVWSFMLAGRSRGLGMTFTTLHLNLEEQAATVLGIPYKEVMQACLLPVAYLKGLNFKPAERPPTKEVVHWEHW
jgi:nitroreductase